MALYTLWGLRKKSGWSGGLEQGVPLVMRRNPLRCGEGPEEMSFRYIEWVAGSLRDRGPGGGCQPVK